MKYLLLFLFLLFVLMGCGEPGGGGIGYQYLGRLKSIQLNCDSIGDYTTILSTNMGKIKVLGKIELDHEPIDYYVWINTTKEVIRLRRCSSSLEYTIIK